MWSLQTNETRIAGSKDEDLAIKMGERISSSSSKSDPDNRKTIIPNPLWLLYTAPRRQTTVTVFFPSKQLLLLAFSMTV